jgi:hypothetical protein
MDEKIIQSALEDALAEKLPASKIDLWPEIEDQLVEGKLIPRQGEIMNTKQYHLIPRFAFVLVILAVLLSILLLTPQGRTFAQSVIQYFTQVNGVSFPLEDTTLRSNEPGLLSATALPPAPLISVAEAEAQAGFPAAELPYVPEGLEYLGARLYGKTINLEYETSDKGGHLIIQQSQEGFYQSQWDQVPPEAVSPVKIGDIEGEFAAGTFVLYPGDTNASWNPEADMLRLRWEKDGVSFEITKTGNPQTLEYLDQEALIEIAENLVYK